MGPPLAASALPASVYKHQMTSYSRARLLRDRHAANNVIEQVRGFEMTQRKQRGHAQTKS